MNDHAPTPSRRRLLGSGLMVLRLVPFAINISLLIYLQWRFDVLQYLAPDRIGATIEAVRAWALDLGPSGPPLVIAAGALGVLFNIPVLPTVIVCVVLYGWLVGGLLAFGIFICGLVLVNLAAHWLGRPVVHKLFGGALEAVNVQLRGRELPSVITLRLIFYMNPIANWLLAISDVGFRNIILGTLIGAVPVAALQIWVATILIDLSRTGEPFAIGESPQLMIRLVIAVGLLLGLRVWWPRRVERRRREAAAEAMNEDEDEVLDSNNGQDRSKG